MNENTFVAPVFPLPNLVFYPDTLLPLHIFEPRYREMTTAAIEGNRVIVIAQLKPGWESDYYGNPPIYEVATAGFLTKYVEEEDGKFDILLRGFSRIRILEELDDTGNLYRTARCEVLEDQAVQDSGKMQTQRNKLLAQLYRVVELKPELNRWGREILRRHEVPGAFSNLLAAFYSMSFGLDGYERQCILEETNVTRRMALIGVQGTRILNRLAGPEDEAREAGTV